MSEFSVSPDEATALTLLDEHDVVPLFAELEIGDATPLATMRRLGVDGRCFLFESAPDGEHGGRHSFLGHQPDEVATLDASDPLRPLEAVASESVAPVPGLDLPFVGGWVGYLGYEAAGCYERLPRARNDPLSLPLADFALYRTLVVFDHARSRLLLLTQLRRSDPSGASPAHAAAVHRLHALWQRITAPGPLAGQTPEPTSARGDARRHESASNLSREDFAAAVRRCLEHIVAGDIFQVQISRRFSLPLEAHPFDVYSVQRGLNPSPYMFYVSTPGCTLVGASPEMLVRVQSSRIHYRPIAGTRRRGRDAADDLAMEAELQASAKEQAEHLMLVDLGRNDVGRVARTGSVAVSDMAAVERYSHVMHLVSRIEAELAAQRSPLDALRACFPAGTVTGAPKIRAMELIAGLEPDTRGPYSGAVGYIGSGGVIDTAIALRTVVVAGGVAHLQAAAGIVADSDPDEEACEIDNKLAAALTAVLEANTR